MQNVKRKLFLKFGDIWLKYVKTFLGIVNEKLT